MSDSLNRFLFTPHRVRALGWGLSRLSGVPRGCCRWGGHSKCWLTPTLPHETKESVRLEKTSESLKSSCEPSTAKPPLIHVPKCSGLSVAEADGNQLWAEGCASCSSSRAGLSLSSPPFLGLLWGRLWAQPAPHGGS